MNDGRESKADDSKPDLKWVVEWLVEREGQRRTAALLGVNGKTVALSLRRERLTGRMRLAIEAVDDLARLVERLTRRVEALEAARQPEDDVGDQAANAPESEGRVLRLFNWRRRRYPRSEEKRDG